MEIRCYVKASVIATWHPLESVVDDEAQPMASTIILGLLAASVDEAADLNVLKFGYSAGSALRKQPSESEAAPIS